MKRFDPVIVTGAIAFTVGFIGLWHLAVATGIVSRIFVASPFAAGNVISERALEGSLWDAVAATTGRMLAGWLLAGVIGVGLGAVIGSSRTVHRLLSPTLELFRPLPASAAIPVAILIFGLNDRMAVSVVAFGALWPILLSTIQGFRSIPREMREVALLYEMGTVRYFLIVALPSASVDIMAGARIALALSLILAVVTEMQASLTGVGYDIFMAQRTYRAADLYAGLIVIGVIGLVINQCLILTERLLFAWKKTS